MRRHHDMGGSGGGEIDPHESYPEPWEKRVDAMTRLLGDDKRKLLRVDELRRAIEDMASEEYDEAGYYGRWATAMATIMIEKGVITIDELRTKLVAFQLDDKEFC